MTSLTEQADHWLLDWLHNELINRLLAWLIDCKQIACKVLSRPRRDKCAEKSWIHWCTLVLGRRTAPQSAKIPLQRIQTRRLAEVITQKDHTNIVITQSFTSSSTWSLHKIQIIIRCFLQKKIIMFSKMRIISLLILFFILFCIFIFDALWCMRWNKSRIQPWNG